MTSTGVRRPGGTLGHVRLGLGGGVSLLVGSLR